MHAEIAQGELENDEDSPPSLAVPAAVPVTVGAFAGQSLAISMRLEAEATLGSDVCLGVEMCGAPGNFMSVMIAPFSGHCYIEDSNSVGTVWKWTAALEALDVNLPIQVWIQVYESGAIRFLRQTEGKDIEDAGLMPAEWFPSWISCYFACVYSWRLPLKAWTTVSVDYAGECFPKKCLEEPKKMDSVWKCFGEDL